MAHSRRSTRQRVRAPGRLNEGARPHGRILAAGTAQWTSPEAVLGIHSGGPHGSGQPLRPTVRPGMLRTYQDAASFIACIRLDPQCGDLDLDIRADLGVSEERVDFAADASKSMHGARRFSRPRTNLAALSATGHFPRRRQQRQPVRPWVATGLAIERVAMISPFQG